LKESTSQRHDRRALPEAFRDLERRPDDGASRTAREQPFLPCQTARGQERVAVGDAHVLVDHRRVEGGGPEILADTLDEVLPRRGRGVDRALGVGPDDEEIGLSLLEEPGGARDRPAGSDREHEDVHLAASLLPKLRPGRLVVRLRVDRIRILVRLVGAGDLLREPVRDRVVALGRLRWHRRRADDDFGAVRAEQADLLLGDLVRHHEDRAVALERGRDGKPDARVPARRLDDRPAGS
jgi:hypothetical protein